MGNLELSFLASQASIELLKRENGEDVEFSSLTKLLKRSANLWDPDASPPSHSGCRRVDRQRRRMVAKVKTWRKKFPDFEPTTVIKTLEAGGNIENVKLVGDFVSLLSWATSNT